MRHRKFGKKLGRGSSCRKALFKSLVASLVTHERIKTTQAKAKAVRGLMEKLITKAKKGSLHSRRQVEAVLGDKKLVNKLVDEIAPRFAGRPGGFTRILKLGTRRGDQTEMVELQLVEVKEGQERRKDKGKKK